MSLTLNIFFNPTQVLDVMCNPCRNRRFRTTSAYPSSISLEEGCEPLDGELRQDIGDVEDAVGADPGLVLPAEDRQASGERKEGHNLGPRNLQRNFLINLRPESITYPRFAKITGWNGTWVELS